MKVELSHIFYNMIYTASVECQVLYYMNKVKSVESHKDCNSNSIKY